jgi:DNA-binding transcriptional LysR family regulator
MSRSMTASSIVEEGFDLGLPRRELKDSNLIARRLAPVRFALCASPGYIKRLGSLLDMVVGLETPVKRD